MIAGAVCGMGVAAAAWHSAALRGTYLSQDLWQRARLHEGGGGRVQVDHQAALHSLEGLRAGNTHTHTQMCTAGCGSPRNCRVYVWGWRGIITWRWRKEEGRLFPALAQPPCRLRWPDGLHQELGNGMTAARGSGAGAERMGLHHPRAACWACCMHLCAGRLHRGT